MVEACIAPEDLVRLEFAKICEHKMMFGGVSDQLLQFYLHSAMRGKWQRVTDEIGISIGFIVWADVNIETIKRLARTNVYPIYPHEWDEGDITLILDVGCTKGFFHQPDVLSFCNHRRKIAFVKRGKLKLYRKETDASKFKVSDVVRMSEIHQA